MIQNEPISGQSVGAVCDISPGVGAHGRAPLRRRPRSLGALMAGFKSIATKRINILRGTPGTRVWQRNYYDHIVRNDDDLNRIRRYIVNNPAQWMYDENHPTNVR